MDTNPLVFQLQSRSGQAASTTILDGLADSGLTVVPCHSIVEVRRQLRSIDPVSPQPVIILVDGTHTSSVGNTTAARVLQQQAGIVVLCDPSEQSLLLRHLQAGADTYCHPDASSELLAAIVLRLVWRMTGPGYARSNDPVAQTPSTGWQLIHQGWVMCAPDGKQITLTTIERSFLTVLLSSPGLQASYDDLRQAIVEQTGKGSTRNPPQLGVLVSRMRRKFSQAGVALPIQAIHRWGYMFTADGVSVAPSVDH